MGQSFKYVEPTIWALRKNVRKVEDEAVPTLHQHIYGYEPIRVSRREETQENVRKGSAENPELNILNPVTSFMVVKLASEDASKA